MHSRKNNPLKAALLSGDLERLREAVEPLTFRIWVTTRLPDGSLQYRCIKTGEIRTELAKNRRELQIDQDDELL